MGLRCFSICYSLFLFP